MLSKRMRVERVRLDMDEVPGRPGLEDRIGLGPEPLAQLGDVVANLAGSSGRRRAVVERVDELLDRHDLVGAQEEDGQHAPLLRAAEADRPVVGDHFERAKDAELHTHSCRP